MRYIAAACLLAVLPAAADDDEKKLPPLALDTPMTWSGEDSRDHDYMLEIARKGVYRIDAKRTCPADSEVAATLRFRTDDNEETLLYQYEVDKVDTQFVFYPVLEAGRYRVKVGLHDSAPQTEIGLALSGPVTLKLTDAERQAGRQAIEKAIQWLLKETPADGERKEELHPVASESLAMMALAEGKEGRGRLALLDEQYVAWLGGKFTVAQGGTWDGKPVRWLDNHGMYEQAIAALGLSAAAEAGSKPAAELGGQLAAYLLAAQAGPSRPAAWKGPINSAEPYYGGWRYQHNEESADISVTGWCMVATVALDAAGLRAPGMADGLELATLFVGRCGSPTGFGYSPKDASNSTRNSIGLLVCLLCGQEGGAVKAAMADVDRRLPAGTQVDDGGHPFYYWYYATRANWLRGKEPWETWRTAMARQLLRRQQPDGRWAGIRSEEGMDRYATALGVMILRMCLDEIPPYLKAEVRGF
jgi:hypothetical protein